MISEERRGKIVERLAKWHLELNAKMESLSDDEKMETLEDEINVLGLSIETLMMSVDEKNRDATILHMMRIFTRHGSRTDEPIER